MTLKDILLTLAIFGISKIEEGIAILKADKWFAGKTNNTTQRYTNIKTGETSTTPKENFTCIDIDGINGIEDYSIITPEFLDKNEGVYAAFIFSISKNFNVLLYFRKIIAHMRNAGIDTNELPLIKRMFVAHLAWALSCLCDHNSAIYMKNDPLVYEMTMRTWTLSLPIVTIEMSTEPNIYYELFVNVASTTDDEKIKSGLALDEERFDYFIELC